jgi:AmmeMemoRadiSam system protein B/AmmeMemoRadiSam system protein A
MTGNKGFVPWLGLVLAVAVFVVTSAAATTVRESALAGTWYPADAKELAADIDALLAEAHASAPPSDLRALIVPHAGYAYSGKTAAAAFALVRGRTFRRVIVLAPSHHSGFHGLSIADVDAYATPLGQVPLDRQAVAQLRKSSLVISDPTAHAHEHSIEIELPFLQRALEPGWRLIPILVGDLDEGDYPQAAALLRPLADVQTLVVVSSDFTHFGPRFGYMPFAPDAEAGQRIRALDDGAIEQIRARDGPGLLKYQAKTGITVCGYRPLALLLYLLPSDAKVQRLAYTTSGELTGDWLNSVSYAALAVSSPAPFFVGRGAASDDAGKSISEADLRRLHRLAVLGVKRAVFGKSDALDREIRQAFVGLPPELEAPTGVFVTLWRGGMLRGCVGYVLDDKEKKPLYRAVLENGVNAASRDYRFLPVGKDELGDLDVEVSVLSPPRPIASPADFQVGKEGIILQKGDHYALFLPQVAGEMGWDREETLAQLARKAGLPGDAWREGATFEVFTTTKYTDSYDGAFAPAGAKLIPTASTTKPRRVSP